MSTVTRDMSVTSRLRTYERTNVRDVRRVYTQQQQQLLRVLDRSDRS